MLNIFAKSIMTAARNPAPQPTRTPAPVKNAPRSTRD